MLEPREFTSPYIIPPHVSFEIVRLSDGVFKKLAHGRFFDAFITDFEIELAFIQKFEFSQSYDERVTALYDAATLAYAKERLKLHYRNCIAIISPKIAEGWNRWSEYILDLFVSNNLYRVLWGSGGCGKSSMFAVLRYICWRVNPSERMCVIASMVVKESKARVFGYISEIHAKAPPSTYHKIEIYVGATNKGIYTQFQDSTGKWVNNERGCIVALPIKVDATSETLGDNLIGLHPEDRLDIDFDEGQEIPGKISEMKIFLNWLTNRPKVYMNFWGNPNPVTFHAKQNYDILFQMGVGNMTEEQVKDREKHLEACDRWDIDKAAVLRLSTLDSPKDDPEEAENLKMSFGAVKHRLAFLSGRDVIESLPEGVSKVSPAYYSQIYGFPFIDYSGEWSKGVLSPRLVALAQEYGLFWRSEPHQLRWFMGVDSAPTGTGDACSIVCGRTGLMMDGRMGVDVANGEFCRTLMKVEEGDEHSFTDYVIAEMLKLSRHLRIPLCNIGIETHSSGEVLKYAMQKSIERGDWGTGWKTQGKHFIVSPVIAPTERYMFKEIGKMLQAKDICADINTEYWLAARCGVQTRQIFNMPDKVLNQFYNRELLLTANAQKYRVERKKEMSKRGVASPNDADAFCNMLEVARRKGAFDFRFRTTGEYDAHFTPELEARMRGNKVKARMSQVGRVLGIDLNGARGGARAGARPGNYWTESI